MPRTITKAKAREMANLRQNKRGGRPKIPAPCPKCGAPCASTRAALGHCA